MPGIGERWPSSNPRLTGLRVWRIEGFEKHLIFYRAADDGIEIVRVSRVRPVNCIFKAA